MHFKSPVLAGLIQKNDFLSRLVNVLTHQDCDYKDDASRNTNNTDEKHQQTKELQN